MSTILLKTAIATNTGHLPIKIAKMLRRADEYTNLCVVAAYEVLNEYNDIISTYSAEDKTIILSTKFGPIETNFRYLDTIFDFGESQGSPILFSHSVHNTASGYISRIFNFKGPIYSISSYTYPLIKALLTAIALLKQNLAKLILIINAEIESDLLNKGIYKLINYQNFSIPSYAIAWLLTNQNNSTDKPTLELANINFKEQTDNKLLQTLFDDIIIKYHQKTKYSKLYNLDIEFTKDIERLFNSKFNNIEFEINSNIIQITGYIYKNN